eukprot:SAG31_NODE_611_length_13558_cov_224.959730_11_plen_269_part_00
MEMEPSFFPKAHDAQGRCFPDVFRASYCPYLTSYHRSCARTSIATSSGAAAAARAAHAVLPQNSPVESRRDGMSAGGLSGRPIHGATFSISALHLAIKVPYFSNSGQTCTNEKVTSLTFGQVEVQAQAVQPAVLAEQFDGSAGRRAVGHHRGLRCAAPELQSRGARSMRNLSRGGSRRPKIRSPPRDGSGAPTSPRPRGCSAGCQRRAPRRCPGRRTRSAARACSPDSDWLAGWLAQLISRRSIVLHTCWWPHRAVQLRAATARPCLA